MKTDKYIIWLIIIYAISRFWAASIGIKFDDYSNTSNIHLYATEAMEANLWETLWYGHMQPPLYSLLMMVSGMSGVIVHTVWIVLGMIATIALYHIGIGFGFGRIISCLVALIWILSPSTLLYENVIIYEFPVACLLILGAWALQRGHLITYSWLCCAIVMTRSLFHPILFLLPALILGWVQTRRK